MAYATNRVHGLGLEPHEFWSMTPRELAAHSKVTERAREFQSHLYAGLQATLHNAHFRGPKDKAFTAEMFLPGYQREAQAPDWKRDLQHAKEALALVKRPDPRASKEAKETINYFADRVKRAQQAQTDGQPREVIERIMTGVA